MKGAIFARGLLTDWLIDTLEAQVDPGLLIGDGIAPLEGGWTGGQPGQGKFRAYSVVTTGSAGRNQTDPLGGSDGSWRVMYSLRSVGGSRQQVEWAGDRTRLVVSRLGKVELDLEGPWTLQQARYETLGAVTRNDSTDPPYWEATDQVALWLERDVDRTPRLPSP